jgi:hypothetical protein
VSPDFSDACIIITRVIDLLAASSPVLPLLTYTGSTSKVPAILCTSFGHVAVYMRVCLWFGISFTILRIWGSIPYPACDLLHWVPSSTPALGSPSSLPGNHSALVWLLWYQLRAQCLRAELLLGHLHKHTAQEVKKLKCTPSRASMCNQEKTAKTPFGGKYKEFYNYKAPC